MGFNLSISNLGQIPNNDITNQNRHNGHSSSISIAQMDKMKEQMNYSIYSINCDESKGSGFLCLINFPEQSNKLKVLVTNYHVLFETQIDKCKEKNITFKDKNIIFKNDHKTYTIKIDKTRKYYINKEYDIIFIEIKDEDNLNQNSFLEIDDNILEEDEEDYIDNNK